ncbi:unnamed protein product, partial [Amoebophrya sp. A120]
VGGARRIAFRRFRAPKGAPEENARKARTPRPRGAAATFYFMARQFYRRRSLMNIAYSLRRVCYLHMSRAAPFVTYECSLRQTRHMIEYSWIDMEAHTYPPGSRWLFHNYNR